MIEFDLNGRGLEAGPRDAHSEGLDDAAADFEGERNGNERLDDINAQADVGYDNVTAKQRYLIHIDVVKIAI